MFNSKQEVILSNIIQCVDRGRPLLKSDIAMFGWLWRNIYLLTVDAELDLSAGVAHRTGGSADVDACILSGRLGNVEVSIRLRLKRWVVPGQWLPPLEEVQAWDHPESTVDKSCLHNSAGTLSLVFTAQPLMSNVISEYPPPPSSLSIPHACTQECRLLHTHLLWT